jgi:2-oxoisovalerate dehydrogenase E1 component
LDEEAIYSSVRKTGKLIILQEDTLFGGIASDISALVTENCFEYLDAPIKRVGAALMPIPFAKNLENLYLPRQRFEQALIELLDF